MIRAHMMVCLRFSEALCLVIMASMVFKFLHYLAIINSLCVVVWAWWLFDGGLGYEWGLVVLASSFLSHSMSCLFIFFCELLIS